jgi:hypothetical protein
MGRAIFLFSSTATRHAVSFQRTAPNGVNRSLAGFSMEANGELLICGLTLVVPDNSTHPGFPLWASSAVFQVANDPLTMFPKIFIIACDLNLPATPFGPLIMFALPILLRISACVLTGSPLTGRVISSQSNTTTPVQTSSYRWLLTNLTEV